MSLFPSTHPKAYQDVKLTLWWYLSFVCGISIPVLVWLLFPNTPILASLANGAVPWWWGGPLILIGGFLSRVLIYDLEVHDKIYDRYFVQWGKYYSLDFILRSLVQPFATKLDARFFAIAEDNRAHVMRALFYYFVGDYDHECQVRENYKLRFYEIVTKYWVSQLNEILLFMLMVIIAVASWAYDRLGLSFERLTFLLLGSILVFLINRLAIRCIRHTMRAMTTDEIEDIHVRFRTELEEQIQKVHQHFNLRYADRAD